MTMPTKSAMTTWPNSDLKNLVILSSTNSPAFVSLNGLPISPSACRGGDHPGRSPLRLVDTRWKWWSQRWSLRSEEHTSELQLPYDLVCRLLLEKKKLHSSTTNSTTQIQDLSSTAALSNT